MKTEKNNQKFQQLIEQNKGILFKVARTYCKDEDDRQDLIQEIMIQIWQSLHRYNDKYAISTWLYRISLNVAISFYRKNGNRQGNFISLNDQFHTVQNVDNSEKEQQLNLLEQFIHELKEIDKALMLLYLEDKSHTEIAEIVGISVSNVSTKIGRIKDKLKRRFSQQNI